MVEAAPQAERIIRLEEKVIRMEEKVGGVQQGNQRGQDHPGEAEMIRSTVGMLLLFCSVLAAQAHDSWIMRGGYRNAAGEGCRDERDCFEIDTRDVRYSSASSSPAPARRSEKIPF
jgi:hypothetical protein